MKQDNEHPGRGESSAAKPQRQATQPPPMPPLPGESDTLKKARDLIIRGPQSTATRSGATPTQRPTQTVMTPTQPSTRQPTPPAQPMPRAVQGQPSPNKALPRRSGRLYQRPDGSLVPDRRTPRPTMLHGTTAPPPVASMRGGTAEVILELPTHYAVKETAQQEDAALVADKSNDHAPATAAQAPTPQVCQICGGAGFLRVDVPLGHPSFGKTIVCACRKRELERRRREELWRISRLEAFSEMTFEAFNHAWPGTQEAYEVARVYAEEMIPPWLLFSGKCGCGKTHLAAAIANARFVQGDLVLFTVVPQLLDHLRATFAPNSESTYDTLFEKVREAGLLILDDLGAEYSTPWAQEKLFQIINHRYMHSLPTVITTNQPLGMMDDRIRSRLSDIRLVRHVAITADDFRPRNATTRGRWDTPRW